MDYKETIQNELVYEGGDGDRSNSNNCIVSHHHMQRLCMNVILKDCAVSAMHDDIKKIFRHVTTLVEESDMKPSQNDRYIRYRNCILDNNKRRRINKVVSKSSIFLN